MKSFIVGIGEALWDVFPDGKKLGGAPANFAYHVSHYGFDGVAVSALGNDSLGDELETLLRAKGLHCCLSRVKYPTGTVQVSLDTDGIPNYEIKAEVAWDNIPSTNELSDMAPYTIAVCFGSLAQRSSVSRDTIYRFLDAVPESCVKVFDINLRQQFYTKEIVESSLKVADILKINDDEIIVVARMFDIQETDIESICTKLKAMFSLDMVILTCGAVGSYVFHDGGMSYRATPEVPVVDTVGAGDSFTAAFMANFLSGKSVEDSHQVAVDVAAYVCTQSGAMPEFNSDENGEPAR